MISRFCEYEDETCSISLVLHAVQYPFHDIAIIGAAVFAPQCCVLQPIMYVQDDRALHIKTCVLIFVKVRQADRSARTTTRQLPPNPYHPTADAAPSYDAVFLHLRPGRLPPAIDLSIGRVQHHIHRLPSRVLRRQQHPHKLHQPAQQMGFRLIPSLRTARHLRPI
jgi:hypothetical protein